MKTIKLMYYSLLYKKKLYHQLTLLLKKVVSGIDDYHLFFLNFCGYSEYISILINKSNNKCVACPFYAFGSVGCSIIRSSSSSTSYSNSMNKIFIELKTFLLINELIYHTKRFLFPIPIIFGKLTRYGKYVIITDSLTTKKALILINHMRDNGLENLQNMVDSIELEYLIRKYSNYYLIFNDSNLKENGKK